MSILVQKAGILTTVQDLGRQGYRRFGINPSGVMDQTATRLTNILLGNDEKESVLEMHFPAPHLVFEADTIFAIGGGEFGAELDGKAVDNWRTIFAAKGSTLKFTGKTSGNRAYLAVRGGFKIDEWLGSASTNLAASVGGFEGRKLETGDKINFKTKLSKPSCFPAVKISPSLIPRYDQFPTIRIKAGAEFERLTDTGRDRLIKGDFILSANSDRMGFRLSGEPIKLSTPFEMLSSAVNFGTIQLLPGGQLIVLMADHQTSGGYPRIAHVISVDLPLLAQLGANDQVAFHLIDQNDAEDRIIEFEKELSFFRVGCKFQANQW